MSRSNKTLVDEEENSEAGFVSRWSRLKHEAQQDIEHTATDNTSLATTVSDGEAEPPVKILTDEDMPDIASLRDDSDYTDFLSPGVSDALRNLALRKLFRSEVFNICDGLDDYDDDYTQFEKLGDIVTSDMKHQIELEAQRMAEREAEQLLQHENQLPDFACTNELDVDNNDSADEDKIAALNQHARQTPPDQSQTLTVSETDVEERTLNATPSVKADTNSNMKKNRHKSDHSAASASLQAKNNIQTTS